MPPEEEIMFCRELNRGKCKTYLLACERTRHAVLIDPLKENTSRYIAVAVYHGFYVYCYSEVSGGDAGREFVGFGDIA